MPLTEEELKELRELKKDPLVKKGRKIIFDSYKEKRELYNLRYLRKKAIKNAERK